MSYAVDRPEILLMENQLQIEKVERTQIYKNDKINELASSEYCHAVFEEYSRQYETVSIAPNIPPTIEPCDYHSLNASSLRFPDVDESQTLEEELNPPTPPDHTRVIHNYHPIGIPHPSVFRKVPTSNKKLIDNCSLGYTKLLVSIGPKEKITYRHKFSEPIFGTVSLYCMSKRGDGDLVKIAESFNFDATPTDIRHTFQHVYRANTLNDMSLNNSNIPLHFNPIGNISKCLFSFPSELLSQDIFLVIELSKVLTGDPDRSLLPYISPDKKNIFGGGGEAGSLQDICTRLRKFRQPVGISVMKVFHDGQVFQNQNSPGGCVLSVFALKHCISDAGLKQHIQDMFPPEGASPQVRLEVTDLDVCLSIHNLGNDLLDNVKPPIGLYSKTDDVVGESDYLYFFPSHFHTDAEAEDISWCQQVRPRFAVRSMLFHPPLNIPLSEDALRSARSSLDNTLFLSPISFENFHRRNERNLCMEVKLIEFLDNGSDDISCPDTFLNREYTILNQIYNPLPGYMFCLSQCTLVSYHKNNPELNDEIKIRLPMKITKNHYLLFHIYHVHVKAKKAESRSSIGGFFTSGSKKGEDTGEIFSLIGQAYLPLLNPSLLCDGEYAIPIIEEAHSTEDGGTGSFSMDTPTSSTPGAVAHQSGVFRTPSHISDPSLYTPTFVPYSQVYVPLAASGNARVNSARRSNSNVKAALPTVTIRTKLFSSFFTTNKDLQNYFDYCPIPLGLPPKDVAADEASPDRTSGRSLKALSTVSTNSTSRPESFDPDLRSATMFFLQSPGGSKRMSVRDIEPISSSASLGDVSASHLADDNLKIEVCRHFPSLMKQIIRVLCGGVSVYQLKYMNPYSHSDLRCTTFLAMLRIFDTIAPNMNGNIDDELADSEFLRSYVEYAFDEEIYASSTSNDDNNSSRKPSALQAESGNQIESSHSSSNKSLTKKAKSMDLVRRQLSSLLSSEELFDHTVDHILEQVVKISYQGALLSSINKISNEITNGKLNLETPIAPSPPATPASASSKDPSQPPSVVNEVHPERWWKGHINAQSILESLLTENNLDYFNALLPNHVPQMHPLIDPLILDPLLPPYRTLDGYVLRKLRLTEMMMEADMKHPPFQWWPWVYEIITYQWRCLLNLFDDSPNVPPSASSNTGSSMNATTAATTSSTISKPDRIDECEEEEEGPDLPDMDDTSSASHQEDESNQFSGWYGKEPYPFQPNDPVLKETSRNSESIRSLLIKYGPTLLNMIFKSLALRIHREHKSPPVVVDEEFIVEAELLFSALGREINLRGKSMLPSRRLNMAIAIFFRNLFSLIAPIQVTRLIYSFLLASRKIQKENQKETQKIQVDQIKTRINFLCELSKIDHFFALNFSLHFGESPSRYHYLPIYSTQDILEHASGTEIRGMKAPPNHWFVHMIIHEIMADYIYLGDALKEGTLKMLRELIVRLNYDKRYQTIEYQNRIACMFLPLLLYFVELSNHLYELTPDSIERRDSLAVVIYILQEVPEYIIREEMRKMTQHQHRTSANIVTTLFPKKTNNKIQSTAQLYKLPIMNMITLLHLIIDTFELSLSDGGEKGDVSVALSPGVIIDSTEAQDIGNRTAPGSLSVFNKASQVRGTAEDKLTKLEALNNKRRISQPPQPTGTGGATSGGASSLTSQSSRPVRGEKRGTEERNWKKSLNAKASSTMTRNLNPSAVSVLRSLTAAKYLNYETSLCVLNLLNIMITDCPALLQQSSSSTSSDSCPSLRSVYSDTSAHYTEPLKEFITNIMSVLLHLLHSTQSEICIVKTYLLSSKIILMFSFTTILKFLGDTFQHWIRKILFGFGSSYASVRQAALEVYEVCLQSCFQYQGTLSAIILPTFGVINDTLTALKNKYRGMDNKPPPPPASGKEKLTHYTALLRSIELLKDSDHDIFIQNFNDSSSFYDSYVASKSLFLNDFLNIIHTLLFINNQLGVIVPYDWNGGLGYNNLYESFKNSIASSCSSSPSSSSSSANSVKFKLISDDMKTRYLSDFKNLDLETTLEQFVKAANAFGTFNLPRFKIYILENLCIIHEIYNQVAEMGMIRWKIYEICEQMEKLSLEIWSPKPPLKIVRRGSDSTVDDRQPHFMAALIASLNLPAAHPWVSLESLRKHAILSLQISVDLFRETHLIYLAERSLNALLGIYRNDHGDNLKHLGNCYDKLSKLFDGASKGNGNINFAMGTFFRVLYIGQGVPSELRGKEYIVRNGSYLHVSEFQALIKQQLQLLVGNDIPVFVLPDTSPMPSDDAQEAYAYMTSLTPVVVNPSDDSANDVTSPTSLCWKKRLDHIAYRNEYSRFLFSVPYTKEGRAHAKTMDLQWKRTTTLTVRYPFPYILSRQIVIKREVRDLSPIEVALDDIQERIISMIDELRKPPSKAQSDINNLMRLVQGTVAPQVNAGAAEVAKVFLPKIKIPADLSCEMDPFQAKHIAVLKDALVQFLEKSRLLLEKYRSITGVSASDLPIDTRSRSLSAVPSSNPTHSSHFSSHALLLPSSSTAQSLMTFPNLCSNSKASTLRNYCIRKYYTRENEAALTQTMEPSFSDGNGKGGSPPGASPTLVVNPSGLPSSSSGTALSSSGSASELVWLTEMEKGFDILVDAIYPFISDIATLTDRN